MTEGGGRIERDPPAVVMRAFEKEVAEFEAHVNSDACEKHHVFGESMLGYDGKRLLGGLF